MYYNITIFFIICRCAYQMHHQCYGSEKFSQHNNAIKSGGFLNQSNVDELVINSTSGCYYENYSLGNNNYKLNNSLVFSYLENFLI